jgi:hypothetical protein
MVSLEEQLRLKSRKDGEDNAKERSSDGNFFNINRPAVSIVCHI